MKKRVLICEFFQETNTFNSIPMGLERFAAIRYAEGRQAYALCKELPCELHGMIDAVEEMGGEVIPSISLYGQVGGRVRDDVLQLLKDRVKRTLNEVGAVDAVCASLHGATCTESEEDACGSFLSWLRELVGERVVIAASFDLHANMTEQMLRSADIVSGYQTYPHVDFYETGHRAASLCMRKLRGEPMYLAAAHVPMMVPPSGYSTLTEPFKGVVDGGRELVEQGKLLDFTVFNVQPFLDIADISSAVVVIAKDEDSAKQYANELAQSLFANRDGYWPELSSVDEIIDRAEDCDSRKPVILVDASDSPNGGALGDSAVVAKRLMERNSKLRAGMFVKDPEAAEKAFAVGVGNSAKFELGGRFTLGMPEGIRAEGVVQSLHDGFFRQEGPAGKGLTHHIGKTAVIRFGTVEIMVCEEPRGSGDPQLLRHFGIEPKLYDLIVVKANTSFRVPYGAFAGEIYYADTPGAGSANLKSFRWQHLPQNLYPFDLSEDYRLEDAKRYR